MDRWSLEVKLEVMEAVSVASSLDVIVLPRVRIVSRNEDALALKK